VKHHAATRNLYIILSSFGLVAIANDVLELEIWNFVHIFAQFLYEPFLLR